MALSGFSENQLSNNLWRETCASMSNQYKHPYLSILLNSCIFFDIIRYLSVCFGFLCNDMNSVLDNPALSLRDRIAVACKYLNNEMVCSQIISITYNSKKIMLIMRY